MKASYLIKGTPGHPIHPPLTDATIGAYTVAVVLAVLGALGVSEANMAVGWWLALIVGLIVNAPASTTGFVDWLGITRGTPPWRTATAHMATMVAAAAFFGLAAIFGHAGYHSGTVDTGPLVLTIVGFLLLTLGGWIGGTIVYVHGMRVLARPTKPAGAAVRPLGSAGEEDEDADADERPGAARLDER